MKKLFNKIFKKSEEKKVSRITSDTVADHREQIISSGRRFKYPLQYSRHKLVINATIISLVAFVLIFLFGWWRLYIAQDTSEFMYRVTRFLPLSVAKVDGQSVAYGDYLMSFRSSLHYSKQKEQLSEKTEDGKKVVLHYKKESLDGAIASAFAKKIANQKNLLISDDELESYMKEQRQSSNGEISQPTFDASILEFLGLSPSEYKHKIRLALLKNKVSFEIDDKALELAKKALELVFVEPDLAKATNQINQGQSDYELVHGSSGWVSKYNQDGGLALTAKNLESGKIFDQLIKSSRGDGYYIIRLSDKNEEQVFYEYIKIPLLEFNNQLNDVINNQNKLKKYIKL